MEGMPRFPMFAPDFKLGCNSLEDNGFQEKIFNYIRSHYGQDPEEFEDDMEELNKIRNYCLLPYPSEDLIPYMKRYYAQLLLLSNQFPLDGKHPDLTFEWQWSDRLHDPNNVLILNDVQFELCNILYNLSCIHAQIGAELPRENDEGIKKAFTHFGYAAYPLQVLRDEMNATRFHTLDFDRDTISLYLNVIMGQAQECMVEKALVESRKPLVVARLTSHLHDMYSKCAEHLVHGPLGDVMSAAKYKEWVRMCTIKSCVYGAISMLYRGMEAEENQQFGERLAYYESALQHITTARSHCAKETRRAYLETVAFVDDVIVFKHQNAKKENDFIYHARIPKPEDITMAEPLAMACAYSFNPLDPSVAGAQLFNGLVPPTVIKASSEYDEKKAALKRSVMEKVEAFDVELMQFIDRIDLTRLVKIISNPYGSRDTESSSLHLPEELLAANSFFSVQNREAVPDVLEQLRVVGEKARDTDTLLTGLIVRLDSIPVADLPNAESAEGVRVIKDECAKLLEASSKAKGTNMNLRLALDERMEAIQTLGMSLEELVGALAPQEQKDYASTSEGARMLQLGEKVEEMKRQRKSLLDKMHEEFLKDNINGKLLIERDTDHKELFEKELKKHDNLLNLLEQNLTAQHRILNALLEANADFAEIGQELREQAEKRNLRILELVSASDEYFRVIAELEQAASFYGKLEERSKKIGQAVETIESAFSDFFNKRNEALASVERKKAEERAALEAAAAMEDFSMPSFPSLSSPIQPPNGGGGGARRNADGAPGRRRLGDYMQYYRDKMGGGGGVSPASSSPLPSMGGPSSHLPYAHSHHPVQPGPPLAPLSIPMQQPPAAGYAESSGAPSPAPSTVSNLSYAPPPMQHPQQQQQYPVSVQQGFPRYSQQPYSGYGQQPSQLPPPQQVQQPGYANPMSQQQPMMPGTMPSRAPYTPPPAAAAALPQQGFLPASTPYAPPPQQLHQQPMSSNYSLPHAASGYGGVMMQPNVSPVSNPTSTPVPTPTVPPSTTVPQQMNRPPLTGMQYPPTSAYGQFPPSMSTAAAASPFAAPTLPSAASPWLQGGATMRMNAATAAAPQPTSQAPPPSVPCVISRPPMGSVHPRVSVPTSAPVVAIPKLPSLSDLGAQLRAASAAPPPVQQMQPMQQGGGGGGPSPWHRGLGGAMGYGGQQTSPWMQQPQPGQQPAAPVAVTQNYPGPAPPSMQQQPRPAAPPVQQMQPPPQPVQQPRNETIDLLSDLFSSGPTTGPAALHPTGVIPMEHQVHTTHAPMHTAGQPILPQQTTVPSVNTVEMVPNGSPSVAAAAAASSTSVVRPAATVLPMQQTSVVQPTNGGGWQGDEQMLSISGTTSVGYAPVVNGENGGEKSSHSPSLTSLLSPSTFSIGEGDATRLAKKQLHASNRGEGAPPTLDPSDPLNQLDPFWMNK